MTKHKFLTKHLCFVMISHEAYFYSLRFLSAIFSQSCLIKTIGGNFHDDPSLLEQKISPAAKQLIDKALNGLDSEKLIDMHVHVVGLGTGNTGLFVNEAMRSFWNFSQNLKYKVYLNASGVKDESRADSQYIERLLALIENSPVKRRFAILAFDKNYNRDGTPNLEKTEFYVPNEYVFELAQKYPRYFVPVMSVHPYRKDALDELNKWARQGVKFMKWLPNAMSIDPGGEGLRGFYKTMKELGVSLLTHAGEEQAVHAKDDQKLGNPLRLRLPLDLGVKVIVAHCASLGQNEDLDKEQKPLADNFDLFYRLMSEAKYEGLLFGEISAMPQANRLPTPLLVMLQEKRWHHRLYNGSDYPLVAINIVVRTKKLQEYGFITKEERAALNEIYEYNPLLFDFVLKRTLKHPQAGSSFSADVFQK